MRRLIVCGGNEAGGIMRDCEAAREEEKVVRLKDALEYLRDEAIRLDLDALTGAIVRALVIIGAQSRLSQPTSRLH